MIQFIWTQYLTLEDYLRTGGVAMIPLAVVSLIMWLLIIDRMLFFRRLYRKNMDAPTAWVHVRDNRVPDPCQYRGAVSLLVARFLDRRSKAQTLDRFILDEIVFTMNRSLNDHLAVIGVLAAAAPLLGLLGTVMGMIDTFDILSVFGTGNAKGMAGGISEALVTTQTGLVIAIPGLYMKGFLDRRARILKQRIARVGYYLRRRL
ncbi:MAG: MotA/TolQ/ExbB proton channel family protein [Thermodesulfobacteriota bacterium]|nr:MotA/TolQ/ExbB proton channel family protein [Thermodesulfobacteriota bacterium]